MSKAQHLVLRATKLALQKSRIKRSEKKMQYSVAKKSGHNTQCLKKIHIKAPSILDIFPTRNRVRVRVLTFFFLCTYFPPQNLIVVGVLMTSTPYKNGRYIFLAPWLLDLLISNTHSVDFFFFKLDTKHWSTPVENTHSAGCMC